MTAYAVDSVHSEKDSGGGIHGVPINGAVAAGGVGLVSNLTGMGERETVQPGHSG